MFDYLPTIRPMRLGVLDVGSNTVHLQVIDAHRGSRPVHASSFKTELRLTEYLDEENRINAEGRVALLRTIDDSLSQSTELDLDEVLAFATSAIREAENGGEIIAEINTKLGLDLQVLSGEEEAKFTFLAVRRWMGWSSGDLLVLDIGGGSLEIAAGSDETPELAHSYPVGAGRMTREFLKGDPFTTKSVDNLRDHLETTLAPLIEEFSPYRSYRVIGTSKTFRTLARLTSELLGDGSGIILKKSLDSLTKRLIEMTISERARLPRVSHSRAHQIVAGAIVARHIMNKLEISSIEICPWALREGIVLRRIDWLENLN
jgi:exopolyphosphatase / guanosine-5'-triphosphate,3'-diphosphate pyrophosphatase